MKLRLIVVLTLLLSPQLQAESYICPVELLETGLIELERVDGGLELTHSVLGTQAVSIMGETDRHLCGGLTDMSDEDTPTIYLFCADKKEKSISVAMGNPFGEDDDSPSMEAWSHSKCFVRSDARE